ncbi:recombination-associated protein RdgC [Solimonas fluminis]|uniref:Recombination-associated protein RdgC n=1 Tax=Solimonas fluminis TaxID=2086571 RepID=A0A2S5TKL4_9GAMM|nr:recombination-associated protein RdgC [Solimonas fluminis]PPE75503.1 recombination-associated protein RdgC [Solimonas fluminis]
MWFKNLQVYRLPPGWAMSPGELEEELARQPLTPCMGQNLQSRGWVAPQGEVPLVRSMERQLMIALGTEQKLLPGSVVRQHADERAAQIEQVKGYKPGKKMMREIKDQVIMELLPRAFVRRRSLRAWIDPTGGWLVVDASAPAKAEELVEMLRNTLNGELAVTLLEPAQAPSALMTGWLSSREAPGRFELGDECELCGTDESKPTVRYVRHGLEGEDIRRHITEGKFATKLGLTWNDKVSFVLTEKLQIKKVKFLAVRETENETSDHPEEQFDIDFALMSGELSLLLKDLAEAVGAPLSGGSERSMKHEMAEA